MARNSRRKTEELHPDQFYRFADGPKFFGLGLTQLRVRIKKGDIPAPIRLCDGGRASGWFGRTIIAWQIEVEEKARVDQQRKREEEARQGEQRGREEQHAPHTKKRHAKRNAA